jgi:hypothetical protein
MAGVDPAVDRPTLARPWPFTLRQYARLLLLRGRLLDQGDPSRREGRYLFSVHRDTVWIEREGDLLRRPMDPT